jgi:hypothetical protein
MSVSVSVVGPYYSSGSISFSSLRTNFKETSSPGEIRASEYRRKTSIDETNAIVPDSTENNNVSTGFNLALSQFRNTIKYYYMTQSGTDINFNINSQPWNGNLGRNIRKQLNIAGTCGSYSTGSPAAQLDSAVNIQITVNGGIYGAGGSAGGGSGGPGFAVYGTRNTSIIMGSGVIFAGGGGGGNGASGADAQPALCFYNSYYSSSGCASASCGSDTTLSQGFGDPCNCQELCTTTGGNAGGKKGKGYVPPTTVCETICTSTIIISYCRKQNNFYIPGGLGGGGGGGGQGQGYGQSRTSGGSGSAGTTSVCSGYNIGTVYATTGGNGGDGGDGGDWGQPGTGGGSSGTALYGSNYTVSGSNGYNVRGSYSAPPPLPGNSGSSSVSCIPQTSSTTFANFKTGRIKFNNGTLSEPLSFFTTSTSTAYNTTIPNKPNYTYGSVQDYIKAEYAFFGRPPESATLSPSGNSWVSLFTTNIGWDLSDLADAIGRAYSAPGGENDQVNAAGGRQAIYDSCNNIW